jgi:hypothetical protein
MVTQCQLTSFPPLFALSLIAIKRVERDRKRVERVRERERERERDRDLKKM